MKMKFAVLVLFFAVFSMAVAEPVYSQKTDFQITEIPKTVDEFLAMRDKTAKTPEGGAVMLLVSLMKFTESEELGMQFLTISLDRSNLEQGNVYRGFAPGGSIRMHLNRLKGASNNPMSYMFYAYVKGGAPANQYNVALPYTVVLSRNRYSGTEESGVVKVFIDCYGVSARPVTLRVDSNGNWKAHELSSMFLNVQPPIVEVTDDL
jgi:hypothetical protein